MKISQKLTVSYIVGALLLLFATGGGLYFFEKLDQDSDFINEELIPLSNSSKKLRISSIEAYEALERGFLLKSSSQINEIESFLSQSSSEMSFLLKNGSLHQHLEIDKLLLSADTHTKEFINASKEILQTNRQSTGVGTSADEEFDALYDSIVEELRLFSLHKEFQTVDLQKRIGNARYLLAHGHLLTAEILSGDFGENFQEVTDSFTHAHQEVTHLEETLKELSKVNKEIQSLSEMAMARYKIMLNLVDKREGAFKRFQDSFLQMNIDAIALEEVLAQAVQDQIASFNRNKKMAQNVQVGISIIGLLGIILIIFFFYVNILNPFAALTHNIKNLEVETDSLTPGVGRSDEIGDMAAVVEDLKKTHQEKAAAVAEMNAQALAMNTHSLVSMTDLEGNIIFANNLFCQISQYEESEILGKDHRVLNSSFHGKDFFGDLWRKIKLGEVWQGEICNKAKDGSLYWIEATILGYKNNLGEIDRYVSIGTDISESKWIEKELVKAFEEAETANAAKSQFLANMSHEIRTPLNSIIGYSDILADDELSLEQRNMAGSVKSSSETLLSLVNDILDLAKVESGEMSLENIPVNLEDLLFEVGESQVSKISNKHVEVNVEFNDAYALVYSDPTRLKQVFMNIMGNAIKFTEEGEVVGAVELISEDENEQTLKCSIRDTGIGMTEEQAAVIFEAFKQADGSTTRKYGGTGLGLNITKQILHKMGTDIQVKSEPGQGSEFFFELKFKKYFPKEAEAEIDCSLLKGKKVLIVDDNSTAINIIKSYCTKINIENYAVGSAEEAYSFLEEAEIDILILDLMMPEVDGYSVAFNVREKYPNIKQVAATADIRPGTIAKVKEYGFDAYLLKPIRRRVLYNTLLDLYQEKSSKVLLTEANADNRFVAKELLVVDDNKMNLKLASKIFSKMGHNVTLAESGAKALELVDKNSFDLIFMDMQMPEMSGVEATQELRRRNVSIPIVALTANAFDSDRQECLAAGMDDFTTKPLRRNELHRMIQKYTSVNGEYIENRILVVEDDKTTSMVIGAIIDKHFPGAVIKNAYDGLEAMALIGSFVPHILILDFMLPDMNGLKVMEFLQSHRDYKDVKVLINSSLEKDDERILKLQEMGAIGVICKGDMSSQKEKIVDYLRRM